MSEITTEREWLACDRPSDFRWCRMGRAASLRFLFLALEWGDRIKHRFAAEDRIWFDAFAARATATGEYPHQILPRPYVDPYPNFDVSYRSTPPHWYIDDFRRNDPMSAATVAAEVAIAELSGKSPGVIEAAQIDYTKSHRKRTGKARQKKAERKAGNDKRWADHQLMITRTQKRFCDEFRDVAGNPFRPVALRPEWLTPTVTDLARSIDIGGRYDVLPVLADAVEEAGRDSAELLSHCRGPGPHVRGCWAIDLLLGRCTIGANTV